MKVLNRIADALERLSELFESYLQQQGARVPPRQSAVAEPPEPGAVSYYEYAREARLEARAEELLLSNRAESFEDAYEKAVGEERQR